PFATLYAHATIEHLATTLLQPEDSGTWSPLIEIQKGGSRRPFFFLHADYEGGGYYCANLARALGTDQPFYTLQPHGFDGGPVPPMLPGRIRAGSRSSGRMRAWGHPRVTLRWAGIK